MTERKIITRDTGKGFKLGYLAWDDLPDAPKRTDEDYEKLYKWGVQQRAKLHARIKELEAKR